MLEKMLDTLEYDKIIQRLESHAATGIGKETVRALTPAHDQETVKHRLQETDEAVKVIRLGSGVSFGGVRDVRASLKRAVIGGMLSGQELLDIAQTMKAARNARRRIVHFHEEHSIPVLYKIMEPVTEERHVEEEIESCIDENAEVKDHASGELARIRSGIRTGEARIREQLEQMIRNPSTQKMLQEQIVTLRGGRYVIPVKQEYRSQFGGMIHDQSSSGATLFIEPERVVQANNKLRELRLKEEREVEKILQRLTAVVAEHEPDIELALTRLAMLDFAFAKAGLANAMKATLPIMNDRGFFKLKKARHPLIPEDEVVPIDVELGNGCSMVIVTGPNTGGKTVTLKTIGLLHLMAMSGLFVSAEDSSRLCIFDAVYADIGDEQSIEQNLSTFSSHMTNIIGMLKNLTPKSLVLLDELGAGTDPTEGSALAVSILEYLRKQDVRVVATTHYSELKAYAYDQVGIMNASMEFDVRTLKPTYRLLLGVPGRSNAFAIAERLGLPRSIIDKAREQVGEDDQRVESMIATLEESRVTAESERESAQKLRQEAEQLKAKYEEQLRQLERQREKMLKKAEQEAEEAVRTAREEAESVISDLRRMAMEEQASIREHKLIEARKRLENSIPSFDMQNSDGRPPEQKELARPGDEVHVESLGRKGYVIEEAGDDHWLVQLGIMKMKVAKTDARPLKSNQSEKTMPSSGITKVKRSAATPIRNELDLRGSSLDDALADVDRFLDEALLANLNQVSIIHGKGTGVLRKGIQDYLKRHKYVKQFRTGGLNEGGSGVTIAELG